uniref:Uncharacterized protein n=1 Tax=Sphaerodactylus townsendi TaxID=933632 RepID=A0ACB8FEE3_9SAUR
MGIPLLHHMGWTHKDKQEQSVLSASSCVSPRSNLPHPNLYKTSLQADPKKIYWQVSRSAPPPPPPKKHPPVINGSLGPHNSSLGPPTLAPDSLLGRIQGAAVDL